MSENSPQPGRQMHDLVAQLFPIHRSLTGDGVRETLSILGEHLPSLTVHEVPTSAKCFDWEIPREWTVNAAYIVDPNGKKICDISDNNLHLVGYSTPVNATLPLDELEPHLHSLPEQPDAIPYVTSYYRDYWGFCISETERQKLQPGDYHVVIDSELFDGSLTYGELFIPGETTREVLVSTYVCHPSMANDELSGPVVATFAAQWTLATDRRLSYRFVFVPETIGAIAFLSTCYQSLKKNVVAGFNLSCIGDDRAYSVVESRKGNTLPTKLPCTSSNTRTRISNDIRFSIGAVMSDNTAVRASICRYVHCREPSSESIPSTTLRQTISIWSPGSPWPDRSRPISRWSPRWKETGPIAT